MERWAEEDEPTVPARLAQARAFMRFGMMDRAWARARDLTEGDDPFEALLLVAEMFILRGWPSKAAEPLAQAKEIAPDDDRVLLLSQRAAEPPAYVDEAAAEARSASVRTVLMVARHHMFTASFLKARVLLERLKRQYPGNREVDDLLWVIEGDFTLDGSLSELAARFGPDIADALEDLPDEPEHTESVTRIEAPVEDPATGQFPDLFRDLDPPTEELEAVREVTESAPMVELAPRSEPPLAPGAAGDTVIATVIGAAEATGPLHKEEAPAPEPFDLDTYRRELGMLAPDSDFDADLESEDDELVILTRRESTELERRETTSDLELLELDPNSEEGPSPDDFVPDLHTARLTPPPSEVPTVVEEDDDETTEPPQPVRKVRRRTRVHDAWVAAPWWALALGLLLMSGAGLLLLFAVLQLLL